MVKTYMNEKFKELIEKDIKNSDDSSRILCGLFRNIRRNKNGGKGRV